MVDSIDETFRILMRQPFEYVVGNVESLILHTKNTCDISDYLNTMGWTKEEYIGEYIRRNFPHE